MRLEGSLLEILRDFHTTKRKQKEEIALIFYSGSCQAWKWYLKVLKLKHPNLYTLSNRNALPKNQFLYSHTFKWTRRYHGNVQRVLPAVWDNLDFSSHVLTFTSNVNLSGNLSHPEHQFYSFVNSEYYVLNSQICFVDIIVII